MVGLGNIVRDDWVFVKSPTWDMGCPCTKTLLTEVTTLPSGGHEVSLQTGNPGAGVRTSPNAATGRPFANTVFTTGITELIGYTQHGRAEKLSGFPKDATGLVMW